MGSGTHASARLAAVVGRVVELLRIAQDLDAAKIGLKWSVAVSMAATG